MSTYLFKPWFCCSFWNVLIFMKIWAFLVSKEQPLRWLWGVARSGYHDTFYPCLTFWAPFNQKNLFVLKISMKCDNLPRSGSCGWLESSGGRQLGLWGQQSHHLGRESLSWSHPRGGGRMCSNPRPRPRLLTQRPRARTRVTIWELVLAFVQAKRRLGKGVQPKRMNPSPRTSGPARDQGHESSKTKTKSDHFWELVLVLLESLFTNWSTY